MNGKNLTPQELTLQQLKEILPEAFAEGKVDWEKLKATLGEDINFANERYVLNWAGKSDAFKVLQIPSTKTLTPAKDESVNFDTTENIFIEGENLEVLKVLQKSYFGKVKMIYIDPPYNTGNDSFIYPDKFSESKADYEKRVGDKDEEGYMTKDGMFRKNSKENGQYHSNWLNMMMPRLYLAKNLLRQDGVIFVSIDDNEVHNLRLLMNEIFGEENFFANLIIVRSEGGGLAKKVIKGHDYLLAFVKNISEFNGIYKPKDIRGKIIIENNKQYWIEEDWLRKEFGKYGTLLYEKIEEIKGIDKKKEIDDGIKNGLYRLIKKGNNHIVGRLRLIEDDGSKFYSILKHLNKNGIDSLKEIEMETYFDYPKPVSLIKELVLGSTIFSKNANDLILDFFAGSGTTAHAVMDLNKGDGGNRKYICVQLPELCDEKSEAFKIGYKTIAEISKERIRRAGKKIQEDDSEHKGDLGFKVMKLEYSNFKQWRQIDGKDAKALKDQMKLFIDPVAKSTTIENMVYELLLKSGRDLNSRIEKKDGCYLINGNELVLLLEKATQKIIDTVIAKNPIKVIALDRLFKGNDQLKTNTVLQMRDAGIEFKTI